MATVNAPFGFRPVKMFGDRSFCNTINSTYEIDPSYGTKIYQGEPVKLNSSGYIVPVDTSTSASDIDATSGDYIGIFWGCEYEDNVLGYTLHSNHFPGANVKSGTTVKAYVVDDPRTQFLVQGDEAGASWPGDLGKQASMSVGSSRGEDTTGVSKLTLDVSSATAPGSSGSQAHTWVIVGVWTDPKNNADDSYPLFRVMVKNGFHTFDSGGTA